MNLAAMCVIVLGIVSENQTSLQYAQVPRYLVTVYDLTRLKPTSSSFLVGIRSIQSRARCPERRGDLVPRRWTSLFRHPPTDYGLQARDKRDAGDDTTRYS